MQNRSDVTGEYDSWQRTVTIYVIDLSLKTLHLAVTDVEYMTAVFHFSCLLIGVRQNQRLMITILNLNWRVSFVL